MRLVRRRRPARGSAPASCRAPTSRAPPGRRRVAEVGVHVDARHEPAAEPERRGHLVVVDLVGRRRRGVERDDASEPSERQAQWTSVERAALKVLRRAHDLRGLHGVGRVVAAEVDRLALHREQLRGDGLLVGGQPLGQRRERAPPGRGRRTAPPAPGPSRAPGRSGCRGCRSRGPCGRATCSPRGTCRSPGRACRRGSARACWRWSGPGARSWPPARRTRRGCPSAGGSPSRAAARASVPSRPRPSRRGRRR